MRLSALNLSVSTRALFAKSVASLPAPPAFVFPAPGLAKENGDSRSANSGSRFAVSTTGLSVRHGQTGVTMLGYAQAMCGNKWVFGEGYQHAVGASSTQAQLERDKQTYIGTNASSPIAGVISATVNPAAATVGTGAGPTDDQWSTGSDGLATCLTQTGKHIFSASVSVNDVAAYYGTPSTAYQTLRTIAAIADAYGAAGKVWYTGNEFPRGDSCYQMESKTVSGGTCTATNTGNFQDGESFGAVGVVGVFASGGPRPLTKVSSAPGQDQYTVTSGGVYTFGGTAPTTAYITYNATPNGGRVTTSNLQRIVKEWSESSAANYVSTVNSVDYGLPGLQYNRPWVRVFDSFNAQLDTSSGGLQTSKPGTMDNLQLHGFHTSSINTGAALRTKFNADYPSAPSLDQKPTRNNWQVGRGTGAATAFTFTLPPSMRSAFTGGPVPTLISVNGAVIGKVDTASGAITGTGISTGTLNFSTGVGSITFTAASSMPANAQLWLEQDIGNFDYTAMTEGTIGRNILMNGLLDPAVYGTDWTGTNLTTTTGTSTVGGVANSAIPFGWSLGNTAMATAVTNATATVTVSNETDENGFARFAMEAYGSHTAVTALQLFQTMNFAGGRLNAGDLLMSGAQMKYAKTAFNGRTYGHTGTTLKTSFNTSAITRNFSAGPLSTIVGIDHQISDSAAGIYIDDQFVTLATANSADSLYRITPLLDTTGTTPSAPQIFINMGTSANVPFAYRLGMGRVQVRRRNDLGAA
jgi:hypothetical protein